MNPTRFLRAAFTEFSKTPALYECSTRSLLGALIQCAQLGLEPGVLGHIYLVPFRNRRRGTVEVTVIPGYRGLLALARRSGEISTIHAHVVLAGDTFSFSYGIDPTLQHSPSAEPRAVTKDGVRVERAMTYVYAACRLKDGGVQFEVMSRADVEAHRDRYAHVTPDSAWSTNFEEMALKTVLRRLCRLLPASTELQRAITLDSQARHAEPQNLATLVSGVEGLGELPEPPAGDRDPIEPPAGGEGEADDAAADPAGGEDAADPRPEAIAAIHEARGALEPPLTGEQWTTICIRVLGGPVALEAADIEPLERLLTLVKDYGAQKPEALKRVKGYLSGR